MKITRLKINNLKAFESREFNLSQLVAICGRNGRGKSTVLNAINFLLGNGVEGEKVDGRNLLALVPDCGKAVSVEASIEYNGTTAEVERRREPTNSGLGRSRVTVNVPDGVDSTPWRMALEGKLASVAHVHEWLSLSKTALRSMIASLADAKTPMPPKIQERINLQSPAESTITSALDRLAASLKTELLETKRELKALSQTMEQRMAMPSGSAEELQALTQRQRDVTTTKTNLQTELSELQRQIAHKRGELSTYSRTGELPADFDLIEAEKVADQDWLKTLWEETQDAGILRDKLRGELSDLREIAAQEENCSKCGQKLPFSLPIPEHLDFLVMSKTEEFQEAEERVAGLMRKGLSASEHQGTVRGQIHAYKCREDKARLEQEIALLEESCAEKTELYQTVEESHLDVYRRVIDMQNAMATARLFTEGEQEKVRLTALVEDISGLHEQTQGVVASMARFGKAALEDRIKNYYSAQLGEPCVNLDEGKIGLSRGDIFYAGQALSGAERDLLATAIDCAVKDLNNTPKIILLEADSVDPDNLKMTLSRIQERLEAGEIDQAILATWFDVSDLSIKDAQVITL
jgi:DNA repair exonuclease SbcCD ATPase subunit